MQYNITDHIKRGEIPDSKMDLTNLTILLVEDVRTTRLQLAALLKEGGCNSISHASTGLEALEILKDKEKPINCIIADFAMPDMNGLQLVQKVRCGYENIPRDLPIAMLTGFGDENLVRLALLMDVDTFILKPVNKAKLFPRLEEMLHKDQGEDWLRSPSYYERHDINSPVRELLKGDTSSIDAAEDLHSSASHETRYRIENAPDNKPLARDIRSKSGKILYPARTILTERHITRLQSLKELGFWDGVLWLHTSAFQSMDESDMSPSGDFYKNTVISSTTFELIGKLSFESRVNCMNCKVEYNPSVETVRRHNRRELHFLYCTSCHKRENDLLCATIKYMNMKGGFPLRPSEIIQAFFTPDPHFKVLEEDPYFVPRDEYQDDPLTKIDIKRWLQDGIFQYNDRMKKLECIIDSLLRDQERVMTLKKIGVDTNELNQGKSLRK